MNSKDISNLGCKTKSGGRNIEDALWRYKNIEFNRVHVFVSKNYSSPRALFEFYSGPHVLR